MSNHNARPRRNLSRWQRFTRTGLAADLRQYAALMTVLFAAVMCLDVVDHLRMAVAR